MPATQPQSEGFVTCRDVTPGTLAFLNHLGQSQNITVSIYEPGGAAWSGGAKLVSLNGFQTKTITPKDDWGLEKKTSGESGHGTPSTDTAYGIVTASSVGSFAVLTYSDEQEHAGSAYSAIYPQDAISEALWACGITTTTPGPARAGSATIFSCSIPIPPLPAW